MRTEEEKKEYQARYRAEHREQNRLYARKWREENPQKATETAKQYRDRHREATIERARKWREEHPDTKYDSRRAYYKRNAEAIKATQRERNRANPHIGRDSKILRKYGMTRSDWEALYQLQNGCCAICEQPTEGKHMKTDHCHKTGEVRGLLCSSCNTALGHFRDNPEYLRSAIVYLNTNREKVNYAR